MSTQTDIDPWYKQFWPWFLISLPLSAVVGGLITITIAIEKPDALVVDDYYKAGLAINETLDREHAAQDLGLTALLRYDGTGQLRLELDADKASDTQLDYLQLKLIHPTLDHKDQSLRLKLENNNIYVSEISDISPGNWYLILTPPGDGWRLTGRLKMPQGGQARLIPGV